MSSNRLTGTIPTSIIYLSPTLKGLYLSDNYFDGTIPSQLGAFTSLEALFLDTNKLSGPIPDSFGGLEDLKQLYLFRNQLTGTVPASLQNLKDLNGIGLESNNIIGEVPDEVCGLVHHKNIDMWADCSGDNVLQCPCCDVCCPGDTCI